MAAVMEAAGAGTRVAGTAANPGTRPVGSATAAAGLATAAAGAQAAGATTDMDAAAGASDSSIRSGIRIPGSATAMATTIRMDTLPRPSSRYRGPTRTLHRLSPQHHRTGTTAPTRRLTTPTCGNARRPGIRLRRPRRASHALHAGPLRRLNRKVV